MDNVDGTADTSSAHLGVSWEVVMIIVLIVVVIAVVFAAIFQRRRRQRRRSRDVEQQARGGALAMPSSSDPEKRGIDIDDAAVDLIRTPPLARYKPPSPYGFWQKPQSTVPPGLYD